MKDFETIHEPMEMYLLIAFTDLTNYGKLASEQTSDETFKYLSYLYELTGDILEPAGGTIIKFIGDASLSIFPGSAVDEGISALIKLKKTIDYYNFQNDIDSNLEVKCHYGKVSIGLVGTKNDKQLDIIGNEVNVCAMLKSRGFVVSEEAFHEMDCKTQKCFDKDEYLSLYILMDDNNPE